jgi:hypothetical protein
MKRLMWAALAVAAFATPAWAGTMENTFANTVTVTDSTGATSSWHFNADGTYTVKVAGPDGAPVEGAGKWVSKDGKICVTPTAAEGAPAEPESCSTYVDGKNVGDTWDITNDAGETFKVSITAGR